MTEAEFWADEAKREGKGRQGWELREDLFREMEEDDERMANELRKNPEGVLNTIKEYLDGLEGEDGKPDEDETIDCYGFCSRHIEGVVEVLDASCNGSMRGSDTGITVKLKMIDGTTRTVEYTEWHDYGSMWEPPDGDVNLAVIAVDDIPVVNRFEYDKDAPPCAVCLREEPPSTKHGVPNTADYLMPLSDDQGKTVKGWELRCSYHMPDRFTGDSWDGPNLGDWYGPVVRLDKHGRDAHPTLPRVRENKDD
jgi:hypothetical protein